MSEDEIFEKFKEIDPDFGKGNRLVKDKNNRLNFPKWTGISPKRKMVNLKIDSILLTSQLIYDIFILGITDSSQRPKCPICGKSCKYSSINDGYSKTCGSVDCCKNQSVIQFINCGLIMIIENSNLIHIKNGLVKKRI